MTVIRSHFKTGKFLTLALEPRIMFDAAVVATVDAVAVDVAATATEPGVTATPTESTVTITDSTDVFPPVDLFENVTVATDGAGQELTDLVITVNSSGANQALVIDGTEITLEATDGARETSSGYSYTVSVSGGVSTIAVSIDSVGGTANDVANLIDNMAYKPLDNTVESGTVTVTLKSLSDQGDTINLDISADIAIDNRINVAPVLSDDGGMEERDTFTLGDLGNATAVAYSSDGKYAYVSGTSGIQIYTVDAQGELTTLQAFSHAELSSVVNMVASADGKSLYTISSEGKLVQLNVGSDGTVSYAATISVNEGGSSGSGSLAISDDGTQVYVDTSSNYSREVHIYSRNTETGALSLLQKLDASRNAVVATSGDYVYVIYSAALSSYNHTLKAYLRGEDGTLSQVAEVSTAHTGQDAVAYSMAASEDGQYLYLGDPSGTIYVYHLSGTELTLVDSTAPGGVSSLALSVDGTLLYAATSTGPINVYAVAADGSLTLLGSIVGNAGSNTTGHDIAISSDGLSLLAAGGGDVARYSSLQNLDVGTPLAFADGLTLSDSNYDSAGNYNGASFTVTANVDTGSFSFAAGNNLALDAENGKILLNGAAIADFTVNGDTLTVTFTATASKTVANQVLHQITYANSSAATSSLIRLTVRGSDGTLNSNEVVINLLTNTAPQLDESVASSLTLGKVTTENAYSFQLPTGLFTDADGNALIWTVTGLPNGLSFDPATRTISGTTTAVGNVTLTVTATDIYGASKSTTLTLEVEQIANRAPIVNEGAPDSLPSATVDVGGYEASLADLFSDPDSIYDGSSLTWSADELPPGLTIDAATGVLSGLPTTVGDYEITITATDEDGAAVSHTLDLRVISQAEADNAAPALSADGSALIYTSDGRINGYGDFVYSVEISDDGRTVIVLGNANGGWQLSPSGNSTLSVYSRNTETGELTLLQRFVQGVSNDGDDSNGVEINGLDSSASATYSADGKYLYLVGKQANSDNYALTAFVVNADGTLSQSGQAVELGSTQVKQIVASSDGYLYAIAGNTLYAYVIGEDGALTVSKIYADQPFGGTAGAIETDDQGRVYVTGANTLTIYGPDGTGKLTTLVSLTSGVAGNFGRSIAVSGDYIYISAGTSGILTFYYDAENNTATKISTLGSQIWGLELSADGKTLYAGNNSGALYIYSIGDDGKPTLVKTVAQQGSSGGYRALRFAISSDGSSMYVGGFYVSGGLAHISVENAISLAYTEGETITPAASITLSDADYDALNNGDGDYNGATIAIQREGGANADDSFGFADSDSLKLVNGEIQLDGAAIGAFSNQDGALTIVFTGTVTTTIANEVLSRITYANASNDPGASIRLSLTAQDQFKSGVASITLALTVAEVNDAPTLGVTPVVANHEPGETAVALFDDAAISTVESGQTIARLTLSVSGLADGAAETLTIDGETVPLVAGNGVTEGGYAYTVTMSEGGAVATVVISKEGMTGAEAAALVNGLAYANADSAATQGERAFSLSVQDSGGVANSGQDTTTFATAARINVLFENPTLGAEAGSLVDAGEINIEGILDVASAGDLVYVISAAEVLDYDTWESSNVTTLSIYQRGTDGALSLLHSVNSKDQAALAGATDIQVSDDGQTILAVGENGVSSFDYDSASGALTSLGEFGAELGAITDILVHGDYAYATAGGSLTAYERSGDSWTEIDVETASDQDTQFTALTLSADGKFLYAGTTGGSTLVSLFSVGEDGALSFVAAAQGKDPAAEDQYYYAAALTLSSDGKTLYVADNGETGGGLHIFSVAESGLLTALEVIAQDGAIKEIAVSSDGAMLLLVGEVQIGVYTRGDDGAFALSATKALGYSWASSVRGAAFSADGAQLYVAGSFSYSDTLLLFDLKPESSTYVEDASAVALLPGGTLADPQLDALNSGLGDYNGASITVERDGDANDDDRFSFIDGDNLTLDAENGKILLGGEAIASFVVADGKLTVTFIAAVTKADAQNVLRRIAYANASDDPTGDGDTASFKVTLNDGDGNSDSFIAEIGLEGVNDPPIVDTTTLSPTFSAEGERVKLFEGTTIDTVEEGQKIWHLTITLDAVNAGDVLGVDGGKIVLDQTASGTQTTGTGLQYSVTSKDGKTIVTIYLMSDADRAAEVVDSLTYGNSGDDLSGTRTISLSVREYGGDSDNDTSTSIQQTVTLKEAASENTAPTLVGDASVAYTEQADPVLLAPNATVSDVQMNAFNGGLGNYDGAVLTVTLGAGSSAADSLGFKAGNDLSLNGSSLMKGDKVIGSVSIANGVLTISFSDDAGAIPTTADVQNALRQITYANSSDVPAASVAVSVTLADQRGLTSNALNLTVNITAVNDAPTLTKDPVLSLGEIELAAADITEAGLGIPATIALSADGKNVYVADETGAIALFSRNADTGELTYVSTFPAIDDLNGVKQMLLSADGQSLYALRADGNAIVWFSLDAEGALTHQATITSDYNVDDGNLYDIQAIALSEDGGNLYLINSNAGQLAYFSRDAATGALTYVAALGGGMWSEPYLWSPTDIVSRGDLVFVTTKIYSGQSTLIVYQRDADGALSLLAYTREGSESLSDIEHVTVSADGSTVYIASGDVISRFALDVDGGSLTFQGSVASEQAIVDIALSADGQTLYATLSNGTLVRYAAGGDSLILVDSRTVAEGAGEIAIADGGAVLLGTGLTALSEQSASPTYVIDKAPVSFAGSYVLFDAELNAADNYKNSVITVVDATESGVFGVADGSGFSINDGQLYLDGTAIATIAQNDGTLTITFTADVTAATANLALRNLTYANDAAASGSVATLAINFSDGAASSGATQVNVAIIDLNDPPTLAATPVPQQIDTEGAATEALFKDAAIDVIEDGQAILSLTLTVSGVKNGASEMLVIDGVDIPLTAGSVTTTNGYAVTITLEGGVATVTISSASGMAVADAEALVNGVSYRGATDSVLSAGERIVTLTSIRDNGGVLEGGIDTAALDIAATVNVVYVNDAPTLTATPAENISYTAGDTAITLFSGAAIDLGDTGQSVLALTFTVSGLASGDGDALIIDGTEIALTTGTIVTANGHTVTVALAGDVATVTVSNASGISVANAEALVNGVAYRSTTDGVLSVGARTITLTAIQDSGGTANGGINSTALDIVASIDVPDAAPLANEDGYVLNASADSSYDATLPQSLFRHPNGDALTWEVDGLPDGLSFDPETRSISGTTAGADSYQLTVTVTDSNGDSATRTLVLTVSVKSSVAPPQAEEFIMSGATPSFAETPVSSGGEIFAPAAPAPLTSGIAAASAFNSSFALSSDPQSFLRPIGERLASSSSFFEAGVESGVSAGSFVFQSDSWVAAVDPSDGRDSVELKLPVQLSGGGISLRMENGMPLPSWARFDPTTGWLSIDARQMERLQHLRIRVQFRPGDGTVRNAVLEIRAQSAKAAAQGERPTPIVFMQDLPAATPEFAPTDIGAEPGTIAVGPHMQDAFPSDLLEEARSLLAQLVDAPNEATPS